MKLVSQVLQVKGFDVWSISPDASMYTALKVMAEHNVGALLVVDQDGLVGVISERDYARKVILEGKSSKETQVREIMSGKVYSVQPDQTIDDCMKLMTENRIRHLPVINEGQLVGVLSIGDVVKAIITDKEYVIGQLENYITGKY
jgi:CBS domain-containing protein